MAEIDIIKELYCYEKMFTKLFETVDECVQICKDPVVEEKLNKHLYKIFHPENI